MDQIAKPEALTSENSVQEVKIENPEGILKKNQELLAELKSLKSKVKADEEKKLFESQEFQKLAELRQKEAEEWREKFTGQQKQIEEAKKLGALRQELSKLGIGSQYMDIATKLADVNKVTYDPETGTITGADLMAKSIFESANPLFGANNPKVSHAAPAASAALLTLESWKALPADERAKRADELYSTLGLKRS